METNVNYTIVGIFVITLLSAAIFGIIWLSSGFSIGNFSTYQINMEESVSGLNVDSPVEFNGVSVGSIKSIELDRNNTQLVILLLDIKVGTPITAGTTATLKTRGITGINYVALKDDNMDPAPLKALRGEKYPVIETTPSLLLRIDAAFSTFSENFQRITKAIDSVLDKENQRALRDLLANLKRASNEFTPLLKATTSTINTLESQTLPRTYQMLNNLDQLSRNLTDISGQIKQNPSILIRGVDGQTLGPGEK